MVYNAIYSVRLVLWDIYFILTYYFQPLHEEPETPTVLSFLIPSFIFILYILCLLPSVFNILYVYLTDI